jgi:beta-galactosidase
MAESQGQGKRELVVGIPAFPRKKASQRMSPLLERHKVYNASLYMLASSICYRPRQLLLATLLLIVGVMSGLAAPRQDQVLADGWKFIKEDAGLTAPTDSWTSVTIPHTWNTKSEDAGADTNRKEPNLKDGYYRGACWYARSLDIPADWKGRRVFIRFEAASLVAKVYLNGQQLGEHRGAFTAFCYELTPDVQFGGTNELRVQVDNRGQKDIPPLSGDFNIDGGIYRPVHLIVTDPVCISPLEMASPGVYLTTKSLTDSAAQVEVKTLVSDGATAAANIQVKTEIADASGKVVATQTQPASVNPGDAQPVISTLNVPAPHRWNGRPDPYLYTATISLVDGANAGDSIQQPLGLRTVDITEDQGFLLNGKPYPIHGVNRHQDWGDQGWAATTADMDEDFQLMLDMGVTAIRLTHYPQSDYVHDLCDHNGILLWNEVSLVNGISLDPAFSANAEQQLREMILQRYNHPSAAFWGLFNEIGLHTTPPPDDLLNHLKSVVQELDSSRLIVCAIYKKKTTYNLIADHPCFNIYPGWYEKLDKLTSDIQACHDEIGKRIGISEYGAGANASQHEEGPPAQGGRGQAQYHPEEWQTYVHETDWAGMKDNPLLWGTFVWCMFDFQVAARHEGGQPDLNDKGLVTQDRKTKKDAYFFYQANWTDKPMVHIASSTMTPRQQATTRVEVFSNCAQVALSVNGTPQDAVSPDGVKVFRWPSVTLQPGNNVILATATSGQGTVTDTCTWVVDPNAPAWGPPPAAPKPADAAP